MKSISTYILLTILSIATFSSCGKFGARTAAAIESSLLPGECLKSNKLIYGENSFEIGGAPGRFVISLSMDLDMENETISKIPGSSRISAYRNRPTDEIFDSFGTDSKNVKDAYYDILNEIGESFVFMTTVYNDGTFRLTANTTFAGVDAGKDLSHLAYIEDSRRVPYSFNPPNGMSSLSRRVQICIPLGDREVATENVVMHLEIPVKVGMLLTTLRDRLITPDAAMNYVDEVLYCDFSIPRIIN